MHRSSKQKINKETQVLNDALDEMDLIDIFRTFHPNAEEYTFSSSHGPFSRIEHTLGHQASPNVRKLRSYHAAFPSHATRLKEKNHKKKTKKQKCREAK